MDTWGQGANLQLGDRRRKAFSSSQRKCTSPGNRRPQWKHSRWTGRKDTMPRAPVCADGGERCQMGQLKNLQQPVGEQPWASETHSGVSCPGVHWRTVSWVQEALGVHHHQPRVCPHQAGRTVTPGPNCYPQTLPTRCPWKPHMHNISATDTNHLCLHLWEPLSKSQWGSGEQCWRQSFCL